MGAVALDVGLLRRRRDFGLLVTGQFVSNAGSFLTVVALPFQVYALTHSSLAVGLLGIAEFVPIVGLGLFGGVLADAVDRRRVVQSAELAAAVVALGLVANALLDAPHLWVLYIAAALNAACIAALRPSLDALVPRLVERDELKAAAAIEFTGHNTAAIGGPALGGVLIAAAGLPVAYAVDALTFVASFALLTRVRTPPRPGGDMLDADALSVRSVKEGLRYAGSRQELIGTYLVDMNAMFFGMPLALFPAIAAGYGGAGVLGLLYAAPAAGGIVVALTSGWTSRVHRHGRAVVYAAAAWGVAIVGFGLVNALVPALALLALAGGMDAISGVFRTAMWNETIPDRLRGRLAGIELISFASGPTLGTAEAGLVAALAGVRASIVSGGLACVAGCAVLALGLPRFWGYDSRAAPEGIAAPARNYP